MGFGLHKKQTPGSIKMVKSPKLGGDLVGWGSKKKQVTSYKSTYRLVED